MGLRSTLSLSGSLFTVPINQARPNSEHRRGHVHGVDTEAKRWWECSEFTQLVN